MLSSFIIFQRLCGLSKCCAALGAQRENVIWTYKGETYMNLTDIKALMQEFANSDIHKFELETDGIKLKLAKESAAKPVVAMPTAAPIPMSTMPSYEAPVIASGALETEKPVLSGTPVKSPVVGTFYSASAPGADPFVTVGQQVKKGQTLCIVEAMKMMNEITAPISGTVTDILVKEEDMVEFDQVIMLIKE